MVQDTGQGVREVVLVDAWGNPLPYQSVDQQAQSFAADILRIAGDVRFLWTPSAGDTTTATDKSRHGRTVTWDASVAARLSKLGLGYAQSFSGTGQFGLVPDADDLSFGNGSVDTPFSLVSVVRFGDTGAGRYVLTKYSGVTREWNVQISSTERLSFELYDEDANQVTLRLSDAAITHSEWAMVGATYSAATGGATAGNDMLLYANGQVIASTPQNNASYVSMVNTSVQLALGGLAGGFSLFAGSKAFDMVVAGVLTPSQMWAIHQRLKSYFGI